MVLIYQSSVLNVLGVVLHYDVQDALVLTTICDDVDFIGDNSRVDWYVRGVVMVDLIRFVTHIIDLVDFGVLTVLHYLEDENLVFDGVGASSRILVDMS